MITEDELNSIRRDVSAIALSLPCEIQRKSITKDQWGGEVESWPAVSKPGLMCGMSEPSAGQLQNYDYLIGSLAAWQVKIPVGTDIEPLDQLLVTGEQIEQILTVQVVLEPRSYPSLLTVLASEIK